MQRRRDLTRYGNGGGHVVEDAGAMEQNSPRAEVDDYSDYVIDDM